MMINLRDTLYVPGFGFILNKTKDQSLGSPEADFAALMEQARAAQVKREAEEAAKEPFIRAKLTKEDIKELATSYDPKNMTQREYDSFLDELIEKGVMEREDLSYIDYRGALIRNGESVCVGHLDFFADNPFDLNGAVTFLRWTGEQGGATHISYRPTDTNVLAWAKEMSLWKPGGAPNSLLDANNRRSDIFAALTDTLGAMERQRWYML